MIFPLEEKKPIPKLLCIKVFDVIAWGVIQASVVRGW
jgi:hypothetical protein